MPANIDLNNAVTIISLLEQAFKLKIKTGNATLSGSFIHPVTGETAKMGGVIFKPLNIGSGFFLGADEAGSVTLSVP